MNPKLIMQTHSFLVFTHPFELYSVSNDRTLPEQHSIEVIWSMDYRTTFDQINIINKGFLQLKKAEAIYGFEVKIQDRAS